MPPDYIIAFIGSIIIAMMMSTKFLARGAQLQQDILKRGIPAEATVIRLWQPPLTSAFTRIYFEFQPGGTKRPIRGCHVDRRANGGSAASLPKIGAGVTVRYLPENPSRAVIVKLVSRFVK